MAASALVPERGYCARARLRGLDDAINVPVPLARKIVLQVAVRDIGQLTDILTLVAPALAGLNRAPSAG